MGKCASHGLSRHMSERVESMSSNILLKPVYSNRFPATPSPVGVPEFRSFHIGRSSGLDITRGGQRDDAASAYVLRPL